MSGKNGQAVTFSVANFSELQHYRDRSPPWIKLYNHLLDDYEFGQLPDATKSHLIAIYLLASRSDNCIPYDSEWIARRINATENVDLDALVQSGFIVLNQELPLPEQSASTSLSKSLPRGEQRRGEREESRAEEIGEVFDFWISTMGKDPSKTKLTDKRRQKIRARLKNYPVDDIKQAIVNCRQSPFHNGTDKNSSKVYDDLELICRDDTKLEQFRDMEIKEKPTKESQNINALLNTELK